MEDLTFGEQVKIILGRKGMTIKQLAEMIEEKTGKKMSRQNLTQRLGRDNFQEQDMRMIADILECPFRLSIMSVEVQPQRSTAALERAAAARTEAVGQKSEPAAESSAKSVETEQGTEPVQAVETVQIPQPETLESAWAAGSEQTEETAPGERDVTIGELYDMHRELAELEENVKAGEPMEEVRKELEKPKKEGLLRGGLFLRRKQRDAAGEPAREAEKTAPADSVEAEYPDGREEADSARNMDQSEAASQTEPSGKAEDDFEPVIPYDDEEEDVSSGEMNPYTGREYQSNSVRMHPTRIGYVQVYDRTIHKWTDMTEWAFLGLQERKKALLGKAYEPPIYLD